MGLQVTSFCYGPTLLLAPQLKPSIRQSRLKSNIVHLAQKISKTPLHSHVRYVIFEVMAVRADTGEESDIPYVRYTLGPGEVTEADAAGPGSGLAPAATAASNAAGGGAGAGAGGAAMDSSA